MDHALASVRSSNPPSMKMTSSIYVCVMIWSVFDSVLGSYHCRTDFSSELASPLSNSSQIPGPMLYHGEAVREDGLAPAAGRAGGSLNSFCVRGIAIDKQPDGAATRYASFRE